MGFIDKYPYTDFHELNLDWILKTIRELGIKMDEFEAVNTITFSGAWDITKQYPAWTVVSDNNIGYISIQPVPAGIVLTNTDYWRIIVDYSAQIAGMQADIINLQNTVGDASSGLVKQTNDNSTDIDDINKKLERGKYLFIFDSYENYGNIYAPIIANLGMTDNVDAFKTGGSGHGFTVSGNYWNDDYTNFCTGRTDLADFKRIIVVGCINDCSDTALASDAALLRSKVNEFIANANSKMPNAVIEIAFCGAALSSSPYLSTRTAENRYTAIGVFKELMAESNNKFLNGTEFIMHATVMFNSSDGVHPNAYGAEQLVKYLTEAIINGQCMVMGQFGYDTDVAFDSGIMHAFQGFRNATENGRTVLYLRTVVCQQTSSAFNIPSTGFDLGRPPASTSIRRSEFVPCVIQVTTGSTHNSYAGKVRIWDGHFYVYSDQLAAGPTYETIAVPSGSRLDLGDLTFENLTLFNL